MNDNEVRQRTKVFALKVIKLVEVLPESEATCVISRQLLRCGTAVGASYRASCRAHLRSDLIERMKGVETDVDEAIYWLELLMESNLAPREKVTELLGEAAQLVTIIDSTVKGLERRQTVGIAGMRLPNKVQNYTGFPMASPVSPLRNS